MYSEKLKITYKFLDTTTHHGFYQEPQVYPSPGRQQEPLRPQQLRL
jgi:hypothetical protein